MVEIEMNICKPLDATMCETNEVFNAQFDTTYEVITSDYEKLNNLPKLNGRTLIGDVWEDDPTIIEMSYNDMKEIWDLVFNKENN